MMGESAQAGSSRDRIREFYSRSGQAYDEIRFRTPRGLFLTEYDVGLFHRMLPDWREDTKVLEVGAGTGRFTIEALRRGYRLTATDINETMLESLSHKLADLGVADRCQLRKEDAFGLSFPDASFDLVVSLHMIPRFLTFADQRAALLELGRVVRPGGRLLFNFRNARSPYRIAYRGPAVTPAQIDGVLAEAGLQCVGRRTKHVLNGTLLDHTPSMLWPLFAMVDRGFERLLPALAWDVFVLAEKTAP